MICVPSCHSVGLKYSFREGQSSDRQTLMGLKALVAVERTKGEDYYLAIYQTSELLSFISSESWNNSLLMSLYVTVHVLKQSTKGLLLSAV